MAIPRKNYAEDAYRRRAMMGMIYFKAHHLKFPLPWHIEHRDHGVVIPITDYDAVVASNGEIVAVVPSKSAEALVELSVSVDGVDDLYGILYILLLTSIVRQFDPRLWLIRPLQPAVDPTHRLVGASDGGFVVNCRVAGDTPHIAMLFFPVREMAQRFCQDAERLRERYVRLSLAGRLILCLSTPLFYERCR